MAEIQKYKKKNGETAYQFQAYLGIDPRTGRKKRTTRRGFNTKREAKIELSRIEKQVGEGTYFQDSYIRGMTDKEVFERWAPGYKNTVKASTFFSVMRIFENHILSNFGNYKIDKITTHMIQQQANEQKKYSNVSKWLNYVNKIFDYALINGMIEKKPIQGVIRPKVKKASKKKFYDRHELKIFMGALEAWDYPQALVYFRVLAFTGLRRGEALPLYQHDIDFEAKLEVSKTLSESEKGLYIETPKTKAFKRTISIDDKTLEILLDWKKHNNHSRIFNNTKDAFLTPSKARRWFRSIIKNTELETIPIHVFRHTHASLLFEAGAQIKEVQKRLGHSKASVTMAVYTHVTKEARDTFAEKFANYIVF